MRKTIKQSFLLAKTHLSLWNSNALVKLGEKEIAEFNKEFPETRFEAWAKAINQGVPEGTTNEAHIVTHKKNASASEYLFKEKANEITIAVSTLHAHRQKQELHRQQIKQIKKGHTPTDKAPKTFPHKKFESFIYRRFGLHKNLG